MWKIERMKTVPQHNGLTNVVVLVEWSYRLDQDGKSHFSRGPVPLELGESFTAFDQLTEQQVLQWVFARINKEVIEQRVADKANLIDRAEANEAALPWA
ncbi:MAG: hypothetical protein EB116_08540 [Betaproteobacteria bacterium]|nr:hypothetical protein [Betaproteobacteria bacterium]